MNRILQLRNRLSLSQSKLADHLGVTRTTLSMVELGKRSLPSAALMKLGEMEKKFEGILTNRNSSDEESNQHMAEEKREAIEQISKRIKDCDYDLGITNIKIDKLNRVYSMSRNVLAVLNETARMPDTTYNQMLEPQIPKSNETVKRHSKAYIKLHIRKTFLMAEIEAGKKLIEEFSAL